jgi:glutamate N-acetyltransferase/amino-acid N-acetyltransferase
VFLGIFLFKTAMFGEDANWGRILAAMGRSGADIEPEKVSISFNGLPILNPNYQVVFKEEDAKKHLMDRVVKIQIDLGMGQASARFWTTDLSDKYIHINADYRT